MSPRYHNFGKHDADYFLFLIPTRKVQSKLKSAALFKNSENLLIITNIEIDWQEFLSRFLGFIFLSIKSRIT